MAACGVALVLAGCADKPPGQADFESGLRELRRNNLLQARTLFKRSIDARPANEANAETYNYLGIACSRLGRVQDAIEAFESARRLSPLAAEATYNLGVLVAENGDPARALVLLRDAAIKDPADSRAFEYMARIHTQAKDWTKARSSCYAALGRAPKSPRILSTTAYIEAQAGRTDVAMGLLRDALARDAHYAPALFNLAVLSQRQGETENARSLFRRYLDEVDVGAQADYARAAIKESSPAPQKPKTPPAAIDSRSGADELIAKARTEADRGHVEDALNLCLQAAQRSASLNRRDEQERALRAGVELYVDSPRAHYALGRFLEAQNRRTEALASYRTASQVGEDFAPAHLAMGQLAIQLKDNDTAVVGLKQAVKLDPSNADALWQYAQLCEKLEMQAQSAQSYRDFAALFAGDPRTAQAREKAKSLDAAARRATAATARALATASNLSARAVAPPPRVPFAPPATPGAHEMTVTLGGPLPDANPDRTPAPRTGGARNVEAAKQAYAAAEAYRGRNDWNNAIRSYEQAVRADDSNADAYFKLALGYTYRLDYGKAKDAYLHTLELQPNNIDARMNLGDPVDGEDVSGRLLSELVSAVASADGDGQGVTLSGFDEISGLIRVGQQLFHGHLALRAMAIFLVALHGF